MGMPLAGWVLACFPGAIFPILLWAYLSGAMTRRERALSLAKVAKGAYSQYFQISEADLDRLAALRKGPYIWPVVLNFLMAAGLTAVSLLRAGMDLPLFPEWVELIRQNVGAHTIAGFWGAYLWGMYDSLVRFRSRSWTPNALHFTWLRLLLGAALGALAAIPFKTEYSPLVAFGLGAFPTDTLRRWLQALTEEKLKIGEKQVSLRPAWTTIQGVTTDVVERLADADIASPCQLACAEPLSLHCKTNIEWRTVLDIIDQAILAGYVEGKIETLRPLGIRGAIEMAALEGRLSSPGGDPYAAQTVKAVAEALGEPEETVRNLIRNLYEDAQVNLIWELWFKN